MDLEIKKLTPELAQDYLHFFDVTPHSTGKSEHRCYCVCWTGTRAEPERYESAEKRREAAAEYIANSFIQGYLAYSGGKVVGWCNANKKADCLECLSWGMFMGAVHTSVQKVKSVFCFAIAAKFRGQGVAAQLLKRVCEDAKAQGYKWVEAYPESTFTDTEQAFMGPLSMYEHFGFEKCEQADTRIVMRKCLE